jgi:hypothetical protein
MSDCLCALICMCCKAVLQPAQPGHEGDAPSHGLGRCCWDQYRRENGLAKREYPEARTR